MNLKEYIDLLLLIGAALALLMTLFLWSSPIKFFGNKILGCLTLSWGFTVFIFAIQSKDFFIEFPHLFGIASALCLLFFPLLYIYVRAFLGESKWGLAKISIHLIPLVSFCIAFSPFYFSGMEYKIYCFNNGLTKYISWVLKFQVYVIIVQGMYYTIKAVRYLHEFNEDNALSKDQITLVKRLKQFVVINILLWAVGTSGIFLEIIQLKISHIDLFVVFYLGLTILILLLGYFALKQPAILMGIDRCFKEEQDEITLENESCTGYFDQDVKKILEHFEKNKPFLKNDLSLQDLVDEIGVPKHRISEILNTHLGKTFYELINDYRVEETKQLIKNGIYENHTLSHIAEMAGFNSKATFNRIFKKSTNKTPSEYIQSTVINK